MGGFLFDVTIQRTARIPIVLEVLSFAAARKEWTLIEHNAGHFLYALDRVEAGGTAVIQPPAPTSHQNAIVSYQRVSDWCDNAGIETVEPTVLRTEGAVEALGIR